MFDNIYEKVRIYNILSNLNKKDISFYFNLIINKIKKLNDQNFKEIIKTINKKENIPYYVSSIIVDEMKFNLKIFKKMYFNNKLKFPREKLTKFLFEIYERDYYILIIEDIIKIFFKIKNKTIKEAIEELKIKDAISLKLHEFYTFYINIQSLNFIKEFGEKKIVKCLKLLKKNKIRHNFITQNIKNKIINEFIEFEQITFPFSKIIFFMEIIYLEIKQNKNVNFSHLIDNLKYKEIEKNKIIKKLWKNILKSDVFMMELKNNIENWNEKRIYQYKKIQDQT